MPARIEAIFFGAIAFLVAAQILAGFASLAYPETPAVDAARQLQVKSGTVCPAPAMARVQAFVPERGARA